MMFVQKTAQLDAVPLWIIAVDMHFVGVQMATICKKEGRGNKGGGAEENDKGQRRGWQVCCREMVLFLNR